MKAVKRGTQKPPSPSRSRTKKDLFDLESDLGDAVNMAGIVAELAEDKLSGGEVTLQPEEVELMLFAIYEAYQRMKAVRDRYLNLEH